ncbi:MAG: glycine--tRNA ligase [Candidatus Kerfeldbacteria bacterium]
MKKWYAERGMKGKSAVTMEQIVNLAKRRGFVFPSAEIYGGLGGFWDWGPLGVLLKNNIKQEWWKTFVQQRDDIVGIDGTIITNPKVWEASGHAQKFADFLIQCKECKKFFKAEDILSEPLKKRILEKVKVEDNKLKDGNILGEESRKIMREFLLALVPEIDKKIACPNCSKMHWTAPDQMNLMFRTALGPSESTNKLVYLRPETAQNIFTSFQTVRESMRLKLPFGIAQVGRVFRNEITPGNFIFRDREFEQLEIEYFVVPDSAPEAFHAWVNDCENWFLGLGISSKHLRQHRYQPDELAHYSRATTDIEYAFPIESGWAELMGIADRTDYDLKQHGKFAKGDELAFATAINEDGKIKKVPYVIEPSWGLDRAALAFLIDAYEVVKGGRSTTTESIKEEEVVLKLHPKLAPYKAAVLPLSKKPELIKVAKEIAAALRNNWMIDYDETGSIGKRYRRQDEIGTPWCITIDFDTLEGGKRKKGTVTIRDRDTMAQEDVAISDLSGWFSNKLA